MLPQLLQLRRAYHDAHTTNTINGFATLMNLAGSTPWEDAGSPHQLQLVSACIYLCLLVPCTTNEKVQSATTVFPVVALEWQCTEPPLILCFIHGLDIAKNTVYH